MKNSGATIDVSAVMRDVRQEVDRRAAVGINVEMLPSGTDSRQAQDLPAPPSLHVTGLQDGSADRFREFTARARQKTEVNRGIPKFLRRLFRRQGGFNKQVLELLAFLRKEDSELQKRVREISAYLQAENGWFVGVERAYRANLLWQNAAYRQVQQLRTLVESLRTQNDAEHEGLRNQIVQEHSQSAESLEGVRTAVERLRIRLESLSTGLQSLSSSAERERIAAETTRTTLASEVEAGNQRFQLQQEKIDAMANMVEALRASVASEAGVREAADKRIALQHERIDTLANILEAVRASLGAEAAAREAAEGRIQLEHERVDQLTNVVEAVREALTAEARERELVAHQLQIERSDADSLRSRVEILAATFREVDARSLDEKAAVDRINAALAKLEISVANLDQRQIANGSYLKRELQLQAQHLMQLMASPRARTAKRGHPAKDFAASFDQHEFDAFYLAFENEFRGTRADIKARTRVYLPMIRKARLGTAKMPVLDLGCGRGEWIELLKDQKLVARGVDLNQFMVAECSERGLPVEQADVLDFLENQADESQGAITAFHLIEHLPFRIQQRFFAQCLRVLRPGGLCIFETPNPENIQVGSNRFYSDPTHLHPLPKDYTKFAMTVVGFTTVEVLPLHPDKNALPLGDNPAPVEQFVNQMFFGEQDYAVIGRK